MNYEVLLETRAAREYQNLPTQMQERIGEVIEDVQKNPRPPGAKPLVGKNGYRVRKGNFRILYTVDDESHVVRIYRIGHRRDVYRSL